MAKINLSTVTGGFNLSTLNNNFQKIAEELNNKVLYRDNPVGEPNQLENSLDLNGERIYNLPTPTLDHEPITLGAAKDLIAGGPYEKTVRAPETINVLPSAAERANKLLTFDATGQPQAQFPSADSATQLRIDLSQTDGGSLIGHNQQTVEEKLDEQVSLADVGGVPVVDCTASIITALAQTTGTVVVPPGDWVANPTLAQVHAVLKIVARINLIGNLTINLPVGEAVGNDTILGVVGGEGELKIVGVASDVFSITGVVSVTGSNGAYDVVLGVSDVTKCALGDFLHTTDTAGTEAHTVHRGVWPIINVNTGLNQITVRNNCWTNRITTATVTSSNSYAIKSIVKVNNNDNLYMRKGQIFLDKLVLRGNASDYWLSSNVTGTEKGTHGIYAGSMTIAVNGKPQSVNPYALSGASVSLGTRVGVYDFDQQGIATELGGWVFGDFVSASFNRRRGFYVSTASGIRAKHISATGNFLDGTITDIGGALYSSSNSCSSGNGQGGCTASSTGNIVFDTGWVQGNGSYGVRAASTGFVQITGGQVGYNGNTGILAEYGSTVYCDSSTINNNTGSGIYSSLGSTIRATGVSINNNTSSALRSDESSIINAPSYTASGNGSVFSMRNGGKILVGSNFVGGSETVNLLTVKNENTALGIRLGASSDGNSVLFGYDNVGSGTYTFKYTMSNNSNGFYPIADSTNTLGRAANRWSTVYAGTGAINTSDERHKVFLDPVEAEKAAAIRIKASIRKYKFTDAIEFKGDGARIHFGVGAQTVKEILEDEGLNPFDYAFLCYDAWDATPEVLDEEGNITVEAQPAGDRYGIRYDELAMFILNAI